MLRAPLTAGTTISSQVLISKFMGEAVWMTAVTPGGNIRRGLGGGIWKGSDLLLPHQTPQGRS